MAAVPPFLFKLPSPFLKRVVALLLFCFMQNLQAAPEQALARIELHTADELYQVLKRSDSLFALAEAGESSPVVFILHGSEAKVFFRQNYSQNKPLVDLAAKLSAFNIVDIKVCKTWMGHHQLQADQLLPFVGTVDNGPAAEQELLLQRNYRYF